MTHSVLGVALPDYRRWLWLKTWDNIIIFLTYRIIKRTSKYILILYLKIRLYFRPKETNLKIYQYFKKCYKCYYVDPANLLQFLLCHLKDNKVTFLTELKASTLIISEMFSSEGKILSVHLSIHPHSAYVVKIFVLYLYYIRDNAYV